MRLPTRMTHARAAPDLFTALGAGVSLFTAHARKVAHFQSRSLSLTRQAPGLAYSDVACQLRSLANVRAWRELE